MSFSPISDFDQNSLNGERCMLSNEPKRTKHAATNAVPEDYVLRGPELPEAEIIFGRPMFIDVRPAALAEAAAESCGMIYPEEYESVVKQLEAKKLLLSRALLEIRENRERLEASILNEAKLYDKIRELTPLDAA